VLLGFAAQSVQ